MKWLFLVLMVPLAVFLLPTTIVLSVSLFPSLIILFFDGTKRHYMTITVFFFNAAGSAYFLDLLWSRGHDLQHVGITLSDTTGWFFSLSGALLGWFIFILLPNIFGQICKAQSSIFIYRLRREQKRLSDLWGTDITKSDR